jgi:hypothetical protein
MSSALGQGFSFGDMAGISNRHFIRFKDFWWVFYSSRKNLSLFINTYLARNPVFYHK